MLISSEKLKKLLLDLLNQAAFPGSMAEFIVEAKREVRDAEIVQPRANLEVMTNR